MKVQRLGLLLVAAGILGLADTAVAADAELQLEADSAPRNTVTIDPIPLAIAGIISVEYERAVLDWMSLFAGPSLNLGLSGVEVDGAESEDASLFALGMTTGVRFFPFQVAPEGFFISPQVSLAYSSASVDDAEGSGLGYSLAAMLGYTFLIADVVDLSLGLGVAYHAYEVEATDADETVTIGYNGVLPAARLALGVAF